ncbi:short-chain dehydrogenase [Amycolatopsis sp. NBRC 101858]|uniref:SDR family NAD(P)-dependent oxidoreductase n=1 Tax=Amycolatopsis sp. NBRC 101858 TaxID=3032200 RepID=UPI0024A05B31|nr:SDR family oxidoreductase [Amycolatopsis sp. NBRC 101858]GLY38880.1 short-chain dehydrogenase [Amycolatopsis sp. NBRC 101858]
MPEHSDHRRFADRTVIVTGAGSGIGLAAAVRIAGEGGHVVAADLDSARLDDLVKLCGNESVTSVDGDITEPEVLNRIVAAAGSRIDGLANVAGIMDGFVPPSEVDDALWERVLNLNLTATMRLTRAVLPAMIAAGRGSIVNVASEAAYRASAAGAAYTTSKHAVVGYTSSVAFFHGPQGVRSNAVAPGPTITNIDGGMRSQYAAVRGGPVMKATMPKPVAPEQVAASIVWLLSDDAANVNGAILPSDGGWSVA